MTDHATEPATASTVRAQAIGMLAGTGFGGIWAMTGLAGRHGGYAAAGGAVVDVVHPPWTRGTKSRSARQPNWRRRQSSAEGSLRWIRHVRLADNMAPEADTAPAAYWAFHPVPGISIPRWR